MSRSFSNNIGSWNVLNVSNNFSVCGHQYGILSWLSPLDPKLRHKDVQDRRVENVGGGVLQTEEFRCWSSGSGGAESDNAILFCYGDPGVGKTYISSLVIDSLCDQVGEQNTTVACFYFDFTVQKEQGTKSMLGALLKQLVEGLQEVPEEISRAYQDQRSAIGGREPRLSDIVRMLQTTSSKKRTFICIDALDECVAGYRVKILDSLNQVLKKSPRTRIFVTGRPYIRSEIEKRLSGRVTSVPITTRRDDITGYLRTRLDEDTTPDAMNSNLEEEILKKILENISEVFLLVSLNIDAILQETTIHRRRQRLSIMTDGLGLGDAYGTTLVRVKRQGGEKARLGMAALMWVTYSVRPLKTEELCHALAVEIGSPNLNTDNVPSMGTLLACCQGLVSVDEETSTVRLIHFTLQKHFLAHPKLFGATHSTIAETCLSYLNSQQVKILSASPSPDPQGTPFLEYSLKYWGTHAKMEPSDCAKSLALKLLDDRNNHISTKTPLKTQKQYWYDADFDKLSLLISLYCTSVFRIISIVVGSVLGGGLDGNQKDYAGDTPFVWTSWKGHKRVVGILFGRGDVNPDKPGRYHRMPLYYATLSGHWGAAKYHWEGATSTWANQMRTAEHHSAVLLELGVLYPYW